jgi:ribonuclease P protein component
LKEAFKKNEKLCSRTVIDRLFQRGSRYSHTFYLFPFRVFYSFDNTREPTLPQVLFSVPKRQFKRAVARNKIKRRCREAYRKNKQPLTQLHSANRPTYIAFLYIAKEIAEYNVIEKSMIRCIDRLSEEKNTED